MALQKNVNSYATVAEADAYFEDRLDVAAWVAADPSEKAKALVTATSVLDEYEWTGTAVSESQTLAFPRNGEFFDPKIGALAFLSPTPDRLITATYDLAYHLLNNDGLFDDTGNVSSLSVAGISLSLIQSANKVPLFVKNKIKPMLLNGGSQTWWRAN